MSELNPDREHEFDPFEDPLSFLARSILSRGHRRLFERVRRASRRRKLRIAHSELARLHLVERRRLIEEAARLRLFMSTIREQRIWARALWLEPARDLDDWREACEDELLAGETLRRMRNPFLRRLAESDMDEWPSASALFRVARSLRKAPLLNLAQRSAAYVEGDEECVLEDLERLESFVGVSELERLAVARVRALLLEAHGKEREARETWSHILERAPEDQLARVSMFLLQVRAGEEEGALATVDELCLSVENAQLEMLDQVLLHRRYMSRAVAAEPSPKGSKLRLELLARGHEVLTKLCLGLM